MCALDLAAVSDSGPQTNKSRFVGLLASLSDSVVNTLEIAGSRSIEIIDESRRRTYHHRPHVGLASRKQGIFVQRSL